MREIKFRAWSNKHKHMFRVKELSQDRDGYTHGLIDEGFEDEYEPDYDHPFAFIGRVDFIKSPDGSTSGLCQDSDDEPFILMQYTGLKDKQGTEIYEGDIVQIKDHAFEGSMKIDGNYEVGYNEYMELCCGGWLLHRQLPYVTVVGNKFENPELLNK